MMKPITGQYECVHRSGIGLDYFTSRIDHLTIQADGRFVLIVQDRSRVSNAAQSLLSGQQVTNAAPETRREGSYTLQGNVVSLRFDDGTQEQGQLAWNGEGLQMGADLFNKVSDSTLLPPTHRMQQNMEDIAKGLKIAGTIGSMAIKAAKTVQGTIQSAQGPAQGQVPIPTQGAPPAQGPAQATAPPPMPVQPAAPTPAPHAPVQSTVNTASTAQGDPDALFCDQCGARRRPGKRFCNNCGARLD
jgi:zinc-ribbon domain